MLIILELLVLIGQLLENLQDGVVIFYNFLELMYRLGDITNL